MPGSRRRSRAPAGRLGDRHADGRVPTVAAEDFLKALLAATSTGVPATNGDLAARLELSPSTITWMLQRLTIRGLIEHTPYHGATLTPEGRRQAGRIVHRHRVIEAFLVDVVGLRAEDVHGEAERLEHVASERLISAMSQSLDRPRGDPQGPPIHPLASARISTSFRSES